MGATVRYREGRGWYVYVYANGKQVAEKCASEAEARATARAVNEKTDARGSWMKGGPLPIRRCLLSWLATHGPELARSTEANSRSLIENHLAPYFDTKDLRSLTRDDVVLFAEDRLKEEYNVI